MLVQLIKEIDKRRCKIVLEDGSSFVLYKGEIRQFCIELGKELRDEDYHLQIVPKLKKRICERILFILKSRDKTEKELSDKLIFAGYPSEVVGYGLSWAKQHNFINDNRYLEAYLDSKSAKTSRQKLLYDLKLKGFSKEDIENALKNTEIDEDTQILELLRKKRYFHEEFSQEKKQKILASIVRRGYSYSSVIKCMNMENNENFSP